MHAAEKDFLTSQYLEPLYWFRYTDDTLFIWIHGKEKFVQFLNGRNNFHPNLSFAYKTSNNNVNFLDLNISFRDCAVHADLYNKDGHQ